MNIERTQYIGHYGVTFTVIRATVLPANRNALVNLGLLDVGVIAKSFIRTYHAGDVVIGIEAQVDGGIGPQRSMSAMVIPFMGGITR